MYTKSRVPVCDKPNNIFIIESLIRRGFGRCTVVRY